MSRHPFTAALLAWYDAHQRSLPWRGAAGIYRIWLAEIIMQQTRISQGLPYYQRFVETWPRLADLAAAPEEEVLRLWQGLGYYSRARHLHRCARVVANELGGRWPATAAGLQKLPGIGPYTAAAIASQVYGEPVPAIDGNVYRVLARYFGLATPINTPAGRKDFTRLSAGLLDPARPGDYNQALMDFGSLQCQPRSPACESCPLAAGCLARARGQQQELPVKIRARQPKERYFTYAVLSYRNKWLLRARPPGDIWQGLYEFMLAETSRPLPHPDPGRLPAFRHLAGMVRWHPEASSFFRHVLTHRILNVTFVPATVTDSRAAARLAAGGYRWYTAGEVEALPKPVLLARYWDSHRYSINLQ